MKKIRVDLHLDQQTWDDFKFIANSQRMSANHYLSKKVESEVEIKRKFSNHEHHIKGKEA